MTVRDQLESLSAIVGIRKMTGIQALERAAPGLPMKPGKVERCEFEYRRHGTQALDESVAAQGCINPLRQRSCR